MTDEGRKLPPREDREEVEFDLDAPPPAATWAGRERARPAPPPEPDPPADGDEPGLEEEEELELQDDDVEASLPPEGAGEAEDEPVAGEEPEAEEQDGAENDAEPEAGAAPEAAGGAAAPAVPDREQSTEAALAGLRARAAAKPASAPPPAGVAAPGGAQAADEEKPGRARPLWARFLAASLIIVISMATATSVSALVLLTDISGIFGGIPGLRDKLTAVEGGDPQTILILGSDKRPTDATGRSDTTILLRVDPDEKQIALLSIPRDLRVEIPNHGEDKFNAAYSYGGPPLTLEVVEKLTGIDVNHVVNVNFNGFADTVDAIGCVYIDADRRYYIAPESGIAEIDIEAGYQRMCGYKALQYVRYRHTDTDLVRAARQQDFLREARQKIEPSKLALDPSYRNKLLKIFGEYTTSDESLRDPIEVLELMKTFVVARNAPINDVPFPAQAGPIYVEASQEAIDAAVDQFMGTQSAADPAPAGEGERDRGGSNGGGRGSKPEPEEPEDEGPAMVDVTGAGQQYAAAFATQKTKDGDPMIEFPIRYPTKLTAGAMIDDESRAFVIDGPGDDVYHGYKFVASFAGASGYPEYYGVSGTDWQDPPILANPSESRVIDGEEYLLFYDAGRLRLVGWKEKQGSYWVINTLTQTLDEDEMLAIATSIDTYED